MLATLDDCLAWIEDEWKGILAWLFVIALGGFLLSALIWNLTHRTPEDPKAAVQALLAHGYEDFALARPFDTDLCPIPALSLTAYDVRAAGAWRHVYVCLDRLGNGLVLASGHPSARLD